MGRILIGVAIGIALTLYTDKKKAERESAKAAEPTTQSEKE